MPGGEFVGGGPSSSTASVRTVSPASGAVTVVNDGEILFVNTAAGPSSVQFPSIKSITRVFKVSSDISNDTNTLTYLPPAGALINGQATATTSSPGTGGAFAPNSTGLYRIDPPSAPVTTVTGVVQHILSTGFITTVASQSSEATSDTNIPGLSVQVPASKNVRTIYASVSCRFMTGDSGSNPERSDNVAIYLDGSVIGRFTPGGVSSTGEDVLDLSLIPIVVPGDNATHTVVIADQATGSTGSITYGNRHLTILDVI